MLNSIERMTALAQDNASAEIPEDLATWLSNLENLVGVPFNYLVPENAMLPPESIRQFHVDPNWVNALVDGAMSIGRHFEGRQKSTVNQLSEHANTLAARSQTTEMKSMVRDAQLSKLPKKDLPALGREKTQEKLNARGLAAPVDLASTPLTGFILRSRVVKGWPSMDVAGYPKGASPYDNSKSPTVKVVPLKVIRLVRLSDEVLFGLFHGDLFELVFHQPAEAIHFGFDSLTHVGGAAHVAKDLRYPTQGWDAATSPYKYLNDQPIANPFHDSDARVLDMMAISQSIGETLNQNNAAPGYYQASPTSDSYKNHLVSSDFGLEMVEGVGLVSFINAQAPEGSQ
ncbi:MAG: hypothetical protein ACRBBS_07255 [Thalassovita sp.]